MLKVLVVFGTRPEAIKLAPVIKELLTHKDQIETRVCVTGQHREMLNQVLTIFDIKPDFDLDIMKPNQTLPDIISAILIGLPKVFIQYRPDVIMIHGDTTSTMAASIVGFCEKIPVAHVEAGLRTGDLYAPWPEEFNRRVAGMVSRMHFSPTEKSKQNLLNEGVDPSTIEVTGNTVIDALLSSVAFIEKNSELQSNFAKQFPFFGEGNKTILLTGHRRENFGGGFYDIFGAIKTLLNKHPTLRIIYPAHLNPNVLIPAKETFQQEIEDQRLFLIPPQDYLSFVYLMQKVDLIITDSGGVQEEAPTFNVPVLVTRTITERPEAVDAGCVELVGSDKEKIVKRAEYFLFDSTRSAFKNPYGDGKASQRIVAALLRQKKVP